MFAIFQVYGLNFSSKDDAEVFAAAMLEALKVRKGAGREECLPRKQPKTRQRSRFCCYPIRSRLHRGKSGAIPASHSLFWKKARGRLLVELQLSLQVVLCVACRGRERQKKSLEVKLASPVAQEEASGGKIGYSGHFPLLFAPVLTPLYRISSTLLRGKQEEKVFPWVG